jgi:hypothetical protein
MEPIGSYIELQLSSGKEYYSSLIKLNTARNSFEYILRVRNYKLVHIPYYTCDVMLEPLHKLGIAYKYYSINNDLDPIIDFEIKESEGFLYTNYFGIKQGTVNKLSKTIKNLVIDNAQAFFSHPVDGIDTIYSCRKFFGVSDGAYLKLNSDIRFTLENDSSVDRMAYLLKRIDFGVEKSYQEYVETDKTLINNDMKFMSPITQRILAGIDYKACQEIRTSNFTHLHSRLSKFNSLNIDSSFINAPLVYPFLLTSTGVKEKLISQKIFVATYWPNVLEWTTPEMFENYLTRHLIPIPIDHRYNHNDMNRIVKILEEIL